MISVVDEIKKKKISTGNVCVLVSLNIRMLSLVSTEKNFLKKRKRGSKYGTLGCGIYFRKKMEFVKFAIICSISGNNQYNRADSG